MDASSEHTLQRVLAILLILSASSLSTERATTFATPGSVVLFGTYDELQIAYPDHVDMVRPPVEVPANHGYLIWPSLSPRGDLVAWGFVTETRQVGSHLSTRYALGIVSLATRQWKSFGNYEGVWRRPLFSRDGSRVLFGATQEGKSALLIFDVDKQLLTEALHFDLPSGALDLASWSPNGKQLALTVTRPYHANHSVAILDLGSGSLTILGDGDAPSYSPNGEWIAYYDPDGTKCLVVHPDGTGVRVVKSLRQSWFSWRAFGWAGPIWSPDGTQLLVNEMRGVDVGLDVVLVDVQTGRDLKKWKNAWPAFGWAKRNP